MGFALGSGHGCPKRGGMSVDDALDMLTTPEAREHTARFQAAWKREGIIAIQTSGSRNAGTTGAGRVWDYLLIRDTGNGPRIESFPASVLQRITERLAGRKGCEALYSFAGAGMRFRSFLDEARFGHVVFGDLYKGGI